MQVASTSVRHETIGDETPEHLAGSLRGHPELAGDLGRCGTAEVVGPDEHAQRQEVFLGSVRQVTLVVAGGGRAGRESGGEASGQDPGRVAATDAPPRRATATPIRVSHETRRTAPSATRRDSLSAASPVADSANAAATAAPSSVIAPKAATDATTGSASRTSSAPTWSARTSGSARPVQVAAKRPQPVISPTSHDTPNAIGSQPR